MRIKVGIQIHSSFASVCQGDVFVFRFVELPAVPPIGSEICGEGWEVTVKEICFDERNGFIDVYGEPDKTFYEKGMGFIFFADTDEFKAHVQEYLDAGWLRAERLNPYPPEAQS